MNIPNILTTLRLCLMPVFLVLYFSPVENARLWAMGVLVFSFLTDVLDGFIARHFNQVSDLGKILDPVADKVMQITVLLCLAFYNHALIWVVAFVLVKDAALGVGAVYMHKRGIVAAGQLVRKGVVLCKLYLLADIDYPVFDPAVGQSCAGFGGCNCCGQPVRPDFVHMRLFQNGL